jgi:serine/threonine protein phosphatase PrpC
MPSDVAWRVAGAAVCGRAHERSGRRCQDALAWAVTPDDVLVAAVADGAGSAPYAEAGARRAVDVAVASLVAAVALRFDEAGVPLAIRDAFSDALEAIAGEARQRGAAIDALATTLVIAVAGRNLSVGSLGDGAIVADEADGGLVRLTDPHCGEHANETIFLSTPGALDALSLRTRPVGAQHVALLTDGITPLALSHASGEPHVAFFAPVFRFADEAHDSLVASAELADFLRSPRVAARTDDDMTLLVASHVDAR